MNARLHIQTALRNGFTSLVQCYFTAPFKVANITEDKRSKQLHLMLMSSSPGILDEDEYGIKIELKEGAKLELHTQSYQRLFNMKTGARQSTEVYLEKGSSFVYLPHPSVPHENSIFISSNKIHLSEDCQLIWGEVLTCGRKLNGEEFRFAKYHNITEIFIYGKLMIRENLLMQPSLTNPSVIGQLEGFTHQASFIFIHEKADCIALSDAVHEYLLLQKEIQFGVTSPSVNGLLVRVLGYKAEQLHDCLKAISKLVSAAPYKKSASTSEALII